MSSNTFSLSSLLREPLIHFLGAAALLFVLNALMATDERELILVDASTQEYLFQQESDLLLRPLYDEEKQRLVDNFIEEEVLVREARRRGFDDSSRVRTLLIQNMRFFYMPDHTERPSDEALRAYFQDHIAEFRSPARRSFEQVFFADPSQVPNDLLQRLQAGEGPIGVGDTTELNARILGVADKAIARGFGPESAPAILAIDNDQWHGPFESAQGVHFLRLIDVLPPAVPRFEDARQWVEAQWDREQLRNAMDDAMSEILPNYRIEIAPVGEAKE